MSAAGQEIRSFAGSGASAQTRLARLLDRYTDVRKRSLDLCEPLEIEDFGLQAMPEVSPARWHLAHTSWYFETFVLKFVDPAYELFDPAYHHLFNSYYNGVGVPYPRPQRGCLSRPTTAEVFRYRQAVDAAMQARLSGLASMQESLLLRLELGLHHEQQHQELILTDLKYCFSLNPLQPAYRPDLPRPPQVQAKAGLEFSGFAAGTYEIGHASSDFAFDNETPRHRVYLEAFRIADAPVSNAEYLEFILDGGYQRAELWLSDGWAEVQSQGWQAPLYWLHQGEHYRVFTLGGLRDLDLEAPVSHVSFYEADAYARWSGRRLPTEAEWEVAAGTQNLDGNFLESGFLEPLAGSGTGPRQFFGDVWEWTASSYSAYPGYRPFAAELGEYNGKFMSGQMVLRGGSSVTASDHIRPSYRNFFYPRDRWQFSGIRLAEDAGVDA